MRRRPGKTVPPRRDRSRASTAGWSSATSARYRGGPRHGGRGRARRAARVLPGRDGRRRLEDGRTADRAGQPLSDKDFQAPARSARSAWRSRIPNVVYVGTGEAPIRGNVSNGDGVYKSTDAGKTWTQRRARPDTLPDLPRPRAPEESGPRLRGGARPRVGPEPRARHLPLEGRRQDLGEGALRLATRPAPRISSWTRPTRGSSTRASGRCTASPGPSNRGGPEGGIYKLDRRRRHLEEARRRAAGGRRRQHRRRRLARAAGPGLGHRRGEGEGRRVPLRRRRREVDARQLREQASPAGLVLHAASTPTRRTPTALYVLNTGFYRSNDGGRTFDADPRPARRQPRPVDRSGRSAAHDRVQRRRRQRLLQRRARAGRRS